MHHIIINKDIDFLDTISISKDEFEDDYNHLVKSLRVKIGEDIRVDIFNDKQDKAYIGKIVYIDSDSIDIEYIKDALFNELPIKINLYQGIPKQDKLEFIVEKATELGVYSITPVIMKNCIKKLDDTDTKKINRLQKIIRQSSYQSMRHIVPEIKAPIKYEKMIQNIVSEDDINILCYEDIDGIKKIDEAVTKIKNTIGKIEDKININIIVGPEGGFDKKEIKLAKDNNIDLYSLGERILRTETAPIVALSQFVNL